MWIRVDRVRIAGPVPSFTSHELLRPDIELMPGVHRSVQTSGPAARDAATGAWRLHVRRVEARDDRAAERAAAAVHDAYAAFLALGVVPGRYDRPGSGDDELLVVHAEHVTWTFAATSAPAAARALAAAAGALPDD